MKKSDFRRWVENIWRENRKEHYLWGDSILSMEQYFAKYKYWLKREYRHRFPK